MQIDLAFRHPGVLLTVTALVGTASAGLLTLTTERQHLQALDSDRTERLAELAKTDAQIRDLSARLDALTTTISSRSLQPERPSATSRDDQARSRASRSQSGVARLQNLQSQVAHQQRDLAQAREEMARSQEAIQGELNTTRQDLQGKLNSARDELGGSIARNHDELTVLQKRGERNFYEFDLTKSKELRRIGPVSLALRKVDAKRKNYNVSMLVEDSRLEKKNINLYEPLSISVPDRRQPVEIVVDFIGKDRVKGYISEAKYKGPELTETTPSAIPRPKELNNR